MIQETLGAPGDPKLGQVCPQLRNRIFHAGRTTGPVARLQKSHDAIFIGAECCQIALLTPLVRELPVQP